MSRKSRMVPTEALETPEQGLTVEAPERDLELEGREVPGDGETLVARIMELRSVLPDSQTAACRACFQRGARAALEALDTKRADLCDQIAALRAAHPPDSAPHQAVSYGQGVEAALQAITQ